MTTFTEPLVVASAGTQGDGTSVFKVSGNDVTVDGDLTVGAHTLAASAVTFVLPTNAEASAGNGGAVPATAAGFFQITVDSTAALVPFFKVPT